MSHHLTPPLEQFRELAGRGNLIPVVIDVVADNETPISAFAKIQGTGDCFLFESAETNEQSGRFSFIGLDPILKFQSNGSIISLTEEGATRTFQAERDPLAELEAAMAKFQFVPAPDIPHFVGGAVGYIGFDIVRFFEPTVKLHARDDLQVPEMMLVIARTLIVFDHRFKKLRLVTNAYVADPAQAETAYAAAQARLNDLLARLRQPVALRDISAARVAHLPAARSNTTRAEFETMVREAKELIAAGDIFQVVLSQRFETDFADNPLDLYRCLRFGNPSPYMFILQFGGDFTAVGSSPEVHVRVRDRAIEIRPIAGTKPRGRDPSEDEQLAAELLADPKERAEHVMLIDLGRNDVGRVAACGSLRVTEQMVIERYSHVMHIVSHVVGKLAAGRTAFAAMRATFPAGTVSGAPKVRAMQIIGQLEKSRRGFYSGIVGYFGFDGSLDSCIALRSIVLKDGKAYLQTGAGIVADSDPGREYDECVNKGKAMLEAVARAHRMDQ
jgi:anthranilate synthase component 1